MKIRQLNWNYENIAGNCVGSAAGVHRIYTVKERPDHWKMTYDGCMMGAASLQEARQHAQESFEMEVEEYLEEIT